LDLGEKIIDSDTLGCPDQTEKIFMESDFLDRTVLKLIVQNGYEPLLKSDKAMALLQ